MHGPSKSEEELQYLGLYFLAPILVDISAVISMQVYLYKSILRVHPFEIDVDVLQQATHRVRSGRGSRMFTNVNLAKNI
jgi:hypothetical protein